jgi:LemA protein
MANFSKYLPLVLIGLLVLLGISMCSTYNRLVPMEEGVKKAWSDVESDYQRRADLIPNLVETVKGYANFEQQTLTQVVEARASATQVKIDANNLTEENIRRFEQAQQGLSGALGRLLAVAEAYPDLKANQNFLALQTQLEGTENRIKIARNKFNEAVQNYNSYVGRFPANLYAGMFGFSKKGYFQAAPGSEKAPEVKF